MFINNFSIQTVIFLLTCNFSFAQSSNKSNYFNGEIEYQYNYETTLLYRDSLAKIKNYKSEFRYDNLNYQSRFFAKDTTSYYYSGKLGKCIGQVNFNGTPECEDYRMPTDTVISYKEYDTDEKIMGYSCKVIEWKGKYFYNIFYVAKDLKIAPGTYEKHKAYNWKFYGEHCGGGLILKSEHRFKNYTMKGIAVNIKKAGKKFKALQIDKKMFANFCK